MKFILSRKSIHSWQKDNVPPCDGAKRELIISRDERTIDDPSKFPRVKGSIKGRGGIRYRSLEDEWYNNPDTSNHRIENGHIVRDYERTFWTIEIKSLDDLIALAESHHNLVINKSTILPFPSIDIYDDYLELGSY